MKRLVVVLSFVVVCTVRAQTVHEVKLSLDDQEMGKTTAYLSAGHLMLPLTAFATMGWKPLLDTENEIIDLAGCLRISNVKPKMWLIGSPPTLGVHSASPLTSKYGTNPIPQHLRKAPRCCSISLAPYLLILASARMISGMH